MPDEYLPLLVSNEKRLSNEKREMASLRANRTCLAMVPR